MMRDYGKVHSSFWSSPTIAALSDDGKMLALYLMTCQHNTIAGVFRLPDGYASEDLGWGSERVTQGFAELFANGFATRCDVTKWVWIHKHLVWNPPENPNQRKSVAKVAAQVPDQCGWKQAFMRLCVQSDAHESELGDAQTHNRSETVPKPFPNQEQEQEQKESLGTLPDADGSLQAGFDRFWAAWPKGERKVGKAKCLAVWKRKKLAKQADWIVSHVIAMTASRQWREGYDPRPESYLNGEQWPAQGDEIAVSGPASRPAATFERPEFRGAI